MSPPGVRQKNSSRWFGVFFFSGRPLSMDLFFFFQSWRLHYVNRKKRLISSFVPFHNCFKKKRKKRRGTKVLLRTALWINIWLMIQIFVREKWKLHIDSCQPWIPRPGPNKGLIYKSQNGRKWDRQSTETKESGMATTNFTVRFKNK